MYKPNEDVVHAMISTIKFSNAATVGLRDAAMEEK